MISRITVDPIDPAQVMAAVGGDEDGAVLLFLGVVRNHADGRPVDGMHYEAYAAMADQVLEEIAGEAAEIAGSDRIAVVHRTGELKIGEASVAIAVSSPHRAEAYAASRHVIEEIKKRLPVWKHEHYLDGEVGWVDGVRLQPGQGGAVAPSGGTE